ncbi:MAG: Maf family protein [Candidatus Kapaibacterium sp.]
MIKISELIGLNNPLILASKSPRRKHLLTQLGFEFEIMPSEFNEDLIVEASPAAQAEKLALAKATDIAAKLGRRAVVVGADTIVVLDGQVLNKPENADHAVEMLQTLSGRTHTVFTGIAIVEAGDSRSVSDVCATEVTFRELGADEIRAYVNGGSPMDKAGAYGIQDDFGAVFVSHINGDYYNIVGLPLELLYRRLTEFVKK